jgi:ATP/maltotriose-dependent transcriptional regulator MalT
VTGRNVPVLAVKVLTERILSAGLSNPEIADEFVVSVNTVKTQVWRFTASSMPTARKGSAL